MKYLLDTNVLRDRALEPAAARVKRTSSVRFSGQKIANQ
jgi:hypothetical protein